MGATVADPIISLTIWDRSAGHSYLGSHTFDASDGGSLVETRRRPASKGTFPRILSDQRARCHARNLDSSSLGNPTPLVPQVYKMRPGLLGC